MATISTLSEAIKHDVAVLTEDLKTLSTGITQRGIDQMHQEIVRWLSPLNPASKQIDVLSRHQEGTGKWLLSSVQFSKWVLGEERFLWCRGMRMLSILPTCGDPYNFYSWRRQNRPHVNTPFFMIIIASSTNVFPNC